MASGDPDPQEIFMGSTTLDKRLVTFYKMYRFTFSGAELLAPLDEDVPEVPGRDGAPPLHVHRLQQTEEN